MPPVQLADETKNCGGTQVSVHLDQLWFLFVHFICQPLILVLS